MLPSVWWEMPETSEVPISEKWIAAEAAAGAMPGGHEQRGRRDAVPHAERAVDELGGQADQGEQHQSCASSHLLVGRSARLE